MIGTIANSAMIIAGGVVGLFLKKGIKQSIEHSVHMATGLAVFVIGLNGVISNMCSVDTATGKVTSSGELLLIFSLIIGVIIGESLGIEERLNGLGDFVEKRFHLTGFAQSFVNGTLIYCVGAMAIMGSLEDGLNGNPSILITKGVLDGITSIVLCATMGPGVIFSAIPVFVYQGALTLLAGWLSPYLQGELLNQICAVGYVMVGCIGANFIKSKTFKVANFLPALLVPPIYMLICYFF